MKEVYMILKGDIEPSSANAEENVGVVSVVYVSSDENITKDRLKELQTQNPGVFFMEYATPLDTDLTTLSHYPSIEISRKDLE